MKVLSDLGFIRYRSVDPAMAPRFSACCGYELPGSYLEFLCFRAPSPLCLSFTLKRADGEQWEGSVTEFENIAPNADALDHLGNQVIMPKHLPGSVFLRLAVDPGGNELYLDLSKGNAPVVDLDYGTGMISEVAPDFETFLEMLQSVQS